MRNDVTRAIAVSERNKSFWKFDFFSFSVWTNVKRKKSVRRRNKKKHSRTSPDVQFKEFSLTKQKTRPRTDYEWIGKTIQKKSDRKNRKNSKNQSEIAACEQKITTDKANFFQTSYSHSTLKLERKNFTPQNHSLFRSISCFGVTKITTPIWLQKSWKCVNRS